ncbi:Putative copper export protein [Fulvimarina pelagi HTCC2506]|uniref:Putative copper export protein n=1 Tax=Fulvimarina pelagi HTCC2506 TaxID=314231 RepID=Q0G021_9HYPH|nr:CopD family protein [Fulvimarina pelagi]EAU40420.1 Putative copper export protein [Fulvimarina pelagi HTCC2506]
MIDLRMVQIVWESPLGTAASSRPWSDPRAPVLVRGTVAGAATLVGATLVAVAFTEVGHSLGDNRAFLAALLTLHILTGAFWVGSFYPLFEVAGEPEGHRILYRFGQVAMGTVAILALAGLGFAWIAVGTITGLTQTAYGVTLLAKIVFVAMLLGLAALNKLFFVPALRTGEPGAARLLKRSIAFEAALVLVIFVATATLTSVTTPPMNLD